METRTNLIKKIEWLEQWLEKCSSEIKNLQSACAAMKRELDELPEEERKQTIM